MAQQAVKPTRYQSGDWVQVTNTGAKQYGKVGQVIGDRIPCLVFFFDRNDNGFFEPSELTPAKERALLILERTSNMSVESLSAIAERMIILEEKVKNCE